MLGQIEGRRRERQRLRRLDSVTDSMDMNLSKLWEIVDRGDWCAATHRVARAGYDLATKQNVQLHTFFFFLYWSWHLVCRILVPQPGIEPLPPAFKYGVLTTGLPKKSSTFTLWHVASCSPSIIYWDFPFSTKQSWHLCQKSPGYLCDGSFLGSLFYSIGLYVSLKANSTVLNTVVFAVSFQTGKWVIQFNSFFRIVLAAQNPLRFLMKFSMSLTIPREKKKSRFWQWLHWSVEYIE